MTESIIKKPRNKSSKRVVIDLNGGKKAELQGKNNKNTTFRIDGLSMSPINAQIDIKPSLRNNSLANITNLSNVDAKSRRSHIHKHKHRHHNKTDINAEVPKAQDDDKRGGIKTPQPVHRVIKISATPTTFMNNNTTATNTSIRMSNIPSAAELIDQNYVNTLKSAKLSLQYIKESINASRQMRYTRQSVMDPFPYTVNQ